MFSVNSAECSPLILELFWLPIPLKKKGAGKESYSLNSLHRGPFKGDIGLYRVL